MRDVRAYLDPEEVDYEAASTMGPDAIPFLMELVQGDDPGLAAKATYLASLLGSERSIPVLQAAAQSKEAVVRVAAAAGVRNLPEAEAEKLADVIVEDADAGVRKVLVRSVAEFRSTRLAKKVQSVAEKDPEGFVRDIAASTAKRMRSRRKK
jgi:HEAT repeat protein